MPSQLHQELPPSDRESIQCPPENTRESYASVFVAEQVYGPAPSCVGHVHSLLTESCEHVIWLYSFFPLGCLPLYYYHPLPDKQLISVCHFLIGPGFAAFIPLFDIYAMVALAISNFDSNFVKLLPFFAIYSVLPFLILLSC